MKSLFKKLTISHRHNLAGLFILFALTISGLGPATLSVHAATNSNPCPSGQHQSYGTGGSGSTLSCVADAPPTCPDGQHQSYGTGGSGSTLNCVDDTPASIMIDYCVRHSKSSLASTCRALDTTSIYNAATYHCKVDPNAPVPETDAEKQAFEDSQNKCIEDASIAILSQVTSSKPKNSSAFKKKLSAVLKADTKKYTGTTKKPNSNVMVHRSPVQAGFLPKTAADSDTLKTVLDIFFGTIGAFALLMITVSGLKYITAGGDPQKASEARNGILYSLLGLVLAVSATAIVSFLVGRV